MIKFQDFKKDKKTSGDGEFDCVRKMNEWIENKNIQVISVETLTEVTGDGFSTDTSFIMFRLWYKELC
ncbi:TPA: hypothetical protein ACS61N_004538 [Klebsiella oxytoca]|uniref:hypothetical protein n=1 Tax=Klebsiella TaxID=570 RepID=UPI001C7F99A2|nr:hypothetical protein [Klebsiella michiganensis]MBX4661259.1 hypothetical protein [Klebsiella michiganensis]HBR0915066.1 hypothetical protein [Klebsiella pneumoniae]